MDFRHTNLMTKKDTEEKCLERFDQTAIHSFALTNCGSFHLLLGSCISGCSLLLFLSIWSCVQFYKECIDRQEQEFHERLHSTPNARASIVVTVPTLYVGSDAAAKLTEPDDFVSREWKFLKDFVSISIYWTSYHNLFIFIVSPIADISSGLSGWCALMKCIFYSVECNIVCNARCWDR